MEDIVEKEGKKSPQKNSSPRENESKSLDQLFEEVLPLTFQNEIFFWSTKISDLIKHGICTGPARL